MLKTIKTALGRAKDTYLFWVTPMFLLGLALMRFVSEPLGLAVVLLTVAPMFYLAAWLVVRLVKSAYDANS